MTRERSFGAHASATIAIIAVALVAYGGAKGGDSVAGRCGQSRNLDD